MTRHCPALLVTAPASGQGKTTLVAALARRQRNLGRRVRVFKVGPDFLDPMVLERASGNPVYQLDLFMGGAAHCRRLLHEAAGAADLILVEGVMGFFDGESSSADLAARFDLPVLAVIDAAAMAQTFGAIAHGLASYREDVRLTGVVANRCAGARHQEMLKQSLPEHIRWYGGLAHDATFSIPERHLGLIQAEEMELADLDTRLDHAAAALGRTADRLPEAIAFAPPTVEAQPADLAGRRIAVARDTVFSFLYRANLDLLSARGAELRFFSPLADDALPECDALWLPGGYPELHLERLAANTDMHSEIRRHHEDGKPILAECGGMLYLAQSLADAEGRAAPLVGLLPAQARMQGRLAGLGLQVVELPGGHGPLRGHTFHHSLLETRLTPIARANGADGGPGEAVYRQGRLTASYMHFYFPSNPWAAAALFAA